MTILDNDLELLEEYLDGGLEESALSKVRDRLVTDKQLSTALVELRSQRALRQAAFASMEPTDLSTQQLMWRVRGAMLDQQRNTAVPTPTPSRWSQWRIASISSAAAACMILGFFFGRLGHGGNAMVSPSNTTDAKISVPITNEYGQVVAWQTFDDANQAKSFTEDYHRTHVQPQRPIGSGQPTLVDQQVPF